MAPNSYNQIGNWKSISMRIKLPKFIKVVSRTKSCLEIKSVDGWNDELKTSPNANFVKRRRFVKKVKCWLQENEGNDNIKGHFQCALCHECSSDLSILKSFQYCWNIKKEAERGTNAEWWWNVQRYVCVYDGETNGLFGFLHGKIYVTERSGTIIFGVKTNVLWKNVVVNIPMINEIWINAKNKLLLICEMKKSNYYWKASKISLLG